MISILNFVDSELKANSMISLDVHSVYNLLLFLFTGDNHDTSQEIRTSVDDESSEGLNSSEHTLTKTPMEIAQAVVNHTLLKHESLLLHTLQEKLSIKIWPSLISTTINVLRS